MARASMSNLIDDLRALANAGTADYSIGATAYFSDDHMQSALERHATIYDFEFMEPFAQRSGAGWVYKIFDSHIANWEDTPQIYDGNGNEVTTGFTVNYQTGRVTFATDQTGIARMISGTAYNVNLAAADVWRQKAAYYADAYDLSTDNHSLSRSQLAAQAKERASYFSAIGRAGQSIQIVRGDM
jgi:hypothetical protein